MTSVIVNADDFGLEERINLGIVQAHTEGIVTATSLMANGAAFEHAVALAEAHPSLDIGVHLTLVEEQPVTDADRIPSLVNESGCFLPDARSFLLRYLSGRISMLELALELEAQIKRIKDTGLQVSHLDGHQHLHVLPGIRRQVIQLARKYEIPFIRKPNESFSFGIHGKTGLKRNLELLALRFFSGIGSWRAYRHADFFFGFAFGGKLTADALDCVIRSLPRSGVCEIMCHPGTPPVDSSKDHWGYHWDDELSALTSPKIRALLSQRGISVTSFRKLLQSC